MPLVLNLCRVLITMTIPVRWIVRSPLKVCVTVLSLTFFSPRLASAQYGSSPSGYYPPGYSGSTFTGVVTETSDDQIVMTQDHKGKIEQFTGHLEMGCAVPRRDGSSHKMTASEFPRSIQLTVFFMTATKSVEGKKVKYNQLIGVTFNESEGKPVPQEKRHFYSCK
jgi:hypothetical protein